MTNPAIIVIAYNRPDSLKRLLTSLERADYKEKTNIPLVISIDKAREPEDNNRPSTKEINVKALNEKTVDVAEKFSWSHGSKKIIFQDTNLGLKKHVLKCGNLVSEYENIIVLEDDLYVAESFYEYACEALFFTKDDEKIAGVSLYNHLFNVNVREPFQALDDGYDNYFLQFASSWGQAFTNNQWQGFAKWLETNDGKDLKATDMPEFVSSWSDKSWLKYCIRYVIETDKFFLYPRVSFTTNFSDEGTHETEANTNFQVPLSGKIKRKLFFSNTENSEAVYDAFFENIKIKNKLISVIEQLKPEINIAFQNAKAETTENDIEIDLYGYKPVSKKRYLLSSKAYSFKIIKEYGRILRPVDANILKDTEGKDFFLYDTLKEAVAPVQTDSQRVLYNYRALNLKKITKVLSYRIFGK